MILLVMDDPREKTALYKMNSEEEGKSFKDDLNSGELRSLTQNSYECSGGGGLSLWMVAQLRKNMTPLPAPSQKKTKTSHVTYIFALGRV